VVAVAGDSSRSRLISPQSAEHALRSLCDGSSLFSCPKGVAACIYSMAKARTDIVVIPKGPIASLTQTADTDRTVLVRPQLCVGS
jgi:hypothetical protein